MVRVIYRFKVKPGQEKAFVAAWTETNNAIRNKCVGARGSVLLRGSTNMTDYVGLAMWNSMDNWQGMRQGDIPNSEITERLMETCEVVSVEPMNDVADMTGESS